ncbi:unnamed protein product [Pieris macdunnoughi]|uniref:Uncharacterized protein n=1 Tax=Pieris macdunnoughi TaxID=345717 RepID=A0A821V667_9NEOP|nr:unnamed protein product [Pieris macdunnoughi]
MQAMHTPTRKKRSNQQEVVKAGKDTRIEETRSEVRDSTEKREATETNQNIPLTSMKTNKISAIDATSATKMELPVKRIVQKKLNYMEISPGAPKSTQTLPNRISEAAHITQSATKHIEASKNLRGEIKLAVLDAIKRLYDLVCEAEDQRKEQINKNKEQVNKSKEQSTANNSKEMEKLEQIENRLIDWEKINLEMENKIERTIRTHLKTYASVLATHKNEPARKNYIPTKTDTEQMHSIIISSTKQETNTEILERIKVTVDPKNTGLRIDKLRKAKDQKVVISCDTKQRLNEVTERIKRDNTLTVKPTKDKDPLIILRGVLQAHSDEDIMHYIKAQNGHLLDKIDESEKRIELKFRRKARNPLLNNIVLQVSPQVWKVITEAGKLHIELQRVVAQDQSPLIQCSRCLAFGHGKRFCEIEKDVCSHCGGDHKKNECTKHIEGSAPICINCKKANAEKTNHNAFDAQCPTRDKWDALARLSVAYC